MLVRSMAPLTLSIAVALLSWRAIAAPTPVERRAVSADLLASFNLFEQYSAASYCAQNNNSTGTEVSCEAGNCPLVDAATTNTVVEFEDSVVTDTTGFVATDSTNSQIYTYGAPRIGPAALSDYITAQGNNYRVTHLNDPVPRLPTLNMGYVHISPEYYISSANDAAVTANDINTYVGNSNLSGNAQWGLAVDIAAHLWYFGDISACE
ncbi:putative mono- and diacylglycerol lipase precursor [Diplodia seriata]|uniref:Putative mono-and diacylglycerol lipase n=1 Tax=Diplodia seriata TaxID=420778 RepID=A0A0G2HB15_9PEZI|nr:putative mono- and diacylglycerol lipase precursor [Diplodia seriata]